jgi:hypothetical protein
MVTSAVFGQEEPMKVALTATTGAIILVWREEDTYHAYRRERRSEEQICLGVDLFEVIAELAGLNLEDEAQAREAIELADQADRRLGDGLGSWTATDCGTGTA